MKSPSPYGATARRDILLLLAWSGLLLTCSLLQMSLMAHDEGNYAAESRFMLESGNWLARQWWGTPTYSHGILLNWLILVGYRLFGVSDRIARLPSVLACIGSVLLTYDIGRTLIAAQPWSYAKYARRLGLLSGLLLMVGSLWAQYGHLATQDMLLVSVELLGIWALLKAEIYARWRIAFGFLAGLTLGLGFLVKTFMIALPALALLPYLVFHHRRHRHLSNPGLYSGLLVGVGAGALWLGLSLAEYGDLVFASMFGKLGELSDESFHADGGPFYYLWNIPVNMLPWALFALIGAVLVLRSLWRSIPKSAPSYPHYWLLLYPFILAGLLTGFPTKTPYYTLQLHPFMAVFAAIALHQIAIWPVRWPRRFLSYAFSALGVLLAALAIFAWGGAVILTPVPDLLSEIRPYAPAALILGVGWAALPAFMSQPQKWLATWLLPAWLAIGTLGLAGLFGNYSSDLKAALASPAIAPIVSDQPISFITGSAEWPPEAHKTFTLLSFYTPQLGQLNRPIAEIPPGTYAWLSPNADLTALSDRPYETMAQLRDWQLIRL
ncbi:glycosyltransferase family 39 protein [Leptolyngbya sp. BC1307]|uniref:ArnT family glycosyltransferase n=1 Tax=Leptolyngbya sp. BC1307 TaxID=2029589 RepID=UPI00148232DA|nr:glycosyltransferase family 39 protein [Leptolyngbya sp. BC1307]